MKFALFAKDVATSLMDDAAGRRVVASALGQDATQAIIRDSGNKDIDSIRLTGCVELFQEPCVLLLPEWEQEVVRGRQRCFLRISIEWTSRPSQTRKGQSAKLRDTSSDRGREKQRRRGEKKRRGAAAYPPLLDRLQMDITKHKRLDSTRILRSNYL